jgi:hypothetical protein
MKVSFKISSLLFLILFVFNFAFSQDENENLKKYWNYRERLKLFVVPGDKPGESLVAAIRNYYDPITKSSIGLSFGQQRAYLGFYIGVLATEYKILADSGLDFSNTLNELDLAINACIRLDTCENKPPWNLLKAKYDGFFMREDVPSNFIMTHPQLNPYKYYDSLSPVYFKKFGNPNCVNKVFSRNGPDTTLPNDPEYFSI